MPGCSTQVVTIFLRSGFAFSAALIAALSPSVPQLVKMISVAMPLYGEPVVFAMLMPLGLCQLALALWLLARGLAERAPLAPAGGG